jgi:hypothetical protein
MGRLAFSIIVLLAVAVTTRAHGAEAPVWELSGDVNFQIYAVDQKHDGSPGAALGPDLDNDGNTDATQTQAYYFGVDEAELQLHVSGTADNGLNYGFKVEINANTDDGRMADEVRLQLSGRWGTVQLGDEDGAEDIMNYGGETIMGATGGFDGDHDDVLVLDFEQFSPRRPDLFADSGDATKISYFTPRLGGFQAGVSITPTMTEGDAFKTDRDYEDHYGVGINYDKGFGDLRLRASAVYAMMYRTAVFEATWPGSHNPNSWQVGAVVDWRGFAIGAGYGFNKDSNLIAPVGIVPPDPADEWWDGSKDYWFWDVAVGYGAGPLYLSTGYFRSEGNFGAGDNVTGDQWYEHFALTVDYAIAPGLMAYAEVDLIEDWSDFGPARANDATLIILGANVSF